MSSSGAPEPDLRSRTVSPVIKVNFVVLSTLCVLAIAGVIALSLRGGDRGGLLGLLVILVFFAILFAFVARSALRSVVLTSNTLSVPVSGSLKSKEFRLEEISGLGLVYRINSVANRGGSRAGNDVPGWRLEVWGSDTEHVRTDNLAAWCSFRLPMTDADSPSFLLRAGKVRFSDDPAVLGATRVGGDVRRIYERVLSVQGSSGPLSDRALQKRLTFNRTDVFEAVAWWSPDGEMKILHATPD